MRSSTQVWRTSNLLVGLPGHSECREVQLPEFADVERALQGCRQSREQRTPGLDAGVRDPVPSASDHALIGRGGLLPRLLERAPQGQAGQRPLGREEHPGLGRGQPAEGEAQALIYPIPAHRVDPGIREAGRGADGEEDPILGEDARGSGLRVDYPWLLPGRPRVRRFR